MPFLSKHSFMQKTIILLVLGSLAALMTQGQTAKQVDHKGQPTYVLPSGIDFNIFLHQSEPDFQEYRDSLELPDGPCVLFYQNNPELPVMEGRVKNGAPEGEWRSYALDRKLKGSVSMLSSVMNFKDGLEDGPFKIYDETGRVALSTGFRNGLEHGPYESRFKLSGEVQTKGHYHMGLRSGKWTIYSLPGIVSKEINYRSSFPADSAGYFGRKETKEGKQQLKGVNDPMLEGVYTIYLAAKARQELTFRKGKLVHYRSLDNDEQVLAEGPCKKLVRVKMDEEGSGFLGLPPIPEWEIVRKGKWTTADPDAKLPKKFIVKGFDLYY